MNLLVFVASVLALPALLAVLASLMTIREHLRELIACLRAGDVRDALHEAYSLPFSLADAIIWAAMMMRPLTLLLWYAVTKVLACMVSREKTTSW